MEIQLIQHHGRIAPHPDCEPALAGLPPWRRHAVHHQLCRSVYAAERKSSRAGDSDGDGDLTARGIAVFPELLGGDEAAEFSDRIGAAIAAGRDGDDAAVAASEEPDDALVVVDSDGDLIGRAAAALPSILGERANAALERYFGSYYRVDCLRIVRTYPTARGHVSFSWHRDAAPMAQVHILAYLTDADDDSGGTSFLDLEQTRMAAEAGYHYPDLNARKNDIDDVFAGTGLTATVNRPRLAAGDGVAFSSSRVLHRGHAPLAGFRDYLIAVLLPSFHPWQTDIEQFGPEYMFVSGSKCTLRSNPFQFFNPSNPDETRRNFAPEAWNRNGDLQPS